MNGEAGPKAGPDPLQGHDSTGHRRGRRVTLDAMHSTVVDETCAQDADRAAAGEIRWVRPLVAHEFCSRVGVCIDWPAGTLMEVTVLGDGIRIRRPIPATETAA